MYNLKLKLVHQVEKLLLLNQGKVQNDYSQVRDREKRESKAPSRYSYADVIAYELEKAEDLSPAEPKTFQEALVSKDSEKWKEAMQEEIDSLQKNKTWKWVDKPEKVKVAGCKWVFRRKEGIPGVEPTWFKARFVACSTQREGVDFNEKISLVVRHTSIRILLALVANEDLKLEQLHIKTAF